MGTCFGMYPFAYYITLAHFIKVLYQLIKKDSRLCPSYQFRMQQLSTFDNIPKEKQKGLFGGLDLHSYTHTHNLLRPAAKPKGQLTLTTTTFPKDMPYSPQAHTRNHCYQYPVTCSIFAESRELVMLVG
jgi:hypothetical protein